MQQIFNDRRKSTGNKVTNLSSVSEVLIQHNLISEYGVFNRSSSSQDAMLLLVQVQYIMGIVIQLKRNTNLS